MIKQIILHYRGFISALSFILKSPFDHLVNILTLTLLIILLGVSLIANQGVNDFKKRNVAFPQMLIYLKSNVNQNDMSTVQNIINRFNRASLIRNYQFISKEQGLKELQQDEALKQIASDVIIDNNNPLPDVFIINTNTTDRRHLEELKEKLGRQAAVDNIEVNFNYADKLRDLINFISKMFYVLQCILTFTVVIAVYNMIKLQMFLRRDEIVVSRLIGASDSFIMRPLVYYALSQILVATALAFRLVGVLVHFINGLFLQFNGLFGKDFSLSPFTHGQLWQICGVLIIFTIFAVFLAVRSVFRKNYTC